MNRLSLAGLVVAVLVGVSGCTAGSAIADPGSPSRTTFTVLQINDVYEITPVEGGRAGGLARVAGLRQQLLAEGTPVVTVMAGDFLSPSALGTARVEGERLYGKQMVAVLNALGLDAAAVGNHEFDVSEDALQARIAEADFPFVSANIVRPDGSPFPNVAPRVVLDLEAADGPVRVGIASVVLPSNEKPYVRYLPADSTLRAEVARLDPVTDVVIGLTHQGFAADATAAATIPGLDAVMGGHEHENVRAYRGPNLTPVMKADANARTAYVHRFTLDRATGTLEVDSELVPITSSTPEDPAVAAIVTEWVEVASAGFRADGFDPDRVAVVTTETLDGRESTVRTRPSRLGGLIADGFRRAAGVEVGLFNGGSIRVDDVLGAGPFTEYDAIRVLPFGGEVVTVEMPGALLSRVLDQGVANAGTGGFLQTAGLEGGPGAWRIEGAALEGDRLYTVATNDFLVTGRETGLDYFDAETNPDVTLIGEHGDVRRALIDELARTYR
ncbi:bifunctional metallophosphatase/5'-nucleotidase [Rubrivirga sp.]|uniref:bifunctional metallophosphatase/5'-nucleotidase n=1 Tax=Rubrivirga sp. TaxID=1885344 RepID=UPI003C78A789